MQPQKKTSFGNRPSASQNLSPASKKEEQKKAFRKTNKQAQNKSKQDKNKIHPLFRLVATLLVDACIIFVAAVWSWSFFFEMYQNSFLWAGLAGFAFWLLLSLPTGGRIGLRFCAVQKGGNIEKQVQTAESYFTIAAALYFVFLAAYYFTVWLLFPDSNVLFGLTISEPLIFRLLVFTMGCISFLSAWFLLRVRVQGFIPGLILLFLNLMSTAYRKNLLSGNPTSSPNGQSVQVQGLGSHVYGLGNFAGELFTALSQLLPLLIFIILLSSISRAKNMTVDK